MRDLFIRLVVAVERIDRALTALVESKPERTARRARNVEARRRAEVAKIKPTDLEVERAKRILRGKP